MGSSLEHKPESGVSLIEVMIAALVLTVALAGLTMTMIQGVAATNYTQKQLIAKHKAREVLESVFTARSTQNITFEQIQNNSIVGGIFLTGFEPIYGMGTDGIANTSDDASTTIESTRLPGNDGLLFTGDDEFLVLSGYERKITITSILDADGGVDPDVHEIAVEVRFKVRNAWHSVKVTSYISRFA